MSITYGWAGTILDIDLTTRKVKHEALPREWALQHLGGSSLLARILYEEVGPEVSPLSPANVILIGHGPLAGTMSPTAGRYELVAKSPLTGIIGRSNGGGNFSPELKWAGYDVVIIRGKAEKPVYVSIRDEKVEIRDAAHLWGKTVKASRTLICDELGDSETGTLVIGPAGENQCMQSAVISDFTRAAGKTAIGAVWGSKNLKGVAVRGTMGTNIARPDEFMNLCKALNRRIQNDPLYETHRKYGTLSWVGGAYSTSAVGKGLTGGLGGEAIAEKAFDPLIERNMACFACPLHCSHMLHVKEGKYKGAKGEGLEGNVQVWGIGMRTLSPAFLAAYNNLCNELGLNVDAPATAINWAMNLWQAGIIDKKDTGGLDLSWGNEESVLELTRQIAYKEGFGAILDDYPIKAAQQVGRDSDRYASHGKGSYTYNFGPGTGTTLCYSLALNVATRGYDHLSGSPSIYAANFREKYGLTNEILARISRDRFGDESVLLDQWGLDIRKAKVVSDFENMCTTADMASVCKFAMWFCLCDKGVDMKDVADLISLATGESFAEEDIIKAAERQILIERAYNAREGVRRIDDYPFAFKWLLEKGTPNPVFNYDKLPFTLKTYDILLDEYYKIRGCNQKTGIPTKARLQELGLNDVSADLDKRGLLSEA